jgi:hypothetical protein
MDHLAPRFRRDVRSEERREGMHVNVVSARTVVAGERCKRLEQVEDVADI